MDSKHSQHDVFINSVKRSRKVKLTFFGDDLVESTQLCVPLDYSPSRRARDDADLYHFVFFDDGRSYVSKLPPNQILDMEESEESFAPSEFIDHDIKWFSARRRWPFSRLAAFFKGLFAPKSDVYHGGDRRKR